MILPTKYPPAVTPANWNAMVDAVNGVTIDGVRSYPFKYLVRNNGGVYEAIDSNHNLAFGGSSDAGSVDGDDPTAVLAAAIADLGNGLLVIENGTYTVDEISIAVSVNIKGLGHVVLKSAGNHPVFNIDLLAVYNASATRKIILEDLDFDGSNISDEPLIELVHTSNVAGVIIQFNNLRFSGGFRGIYQNSTKILYGMGCQINNVRAFNMTGASIYFQCVTDVFLENFCVYNSFTENTESNVILNSVQSGVVYGSGLMINGLTVLSKSTGSVDYSVQIYNKVVHANNIEIDTSAGAGLLLKGYYLNIDNFEVSGVKGSAIEIQGSWIGLTNGKLKDNYNHGVLVTSGNYIQISCCNFVNNGLAADATYDDIYITANQGANCIISATCNNANASNRTNYAAYLGANSYGIINITATGQRAGAIYYDTTKIWSENSITSGVLTKPSRIIWHTASYGVLTDTDRTSSMSDYADLDLTASTSTMARAAILQVRINPSVVADPGGYVHIKLRQNGASSSESVALVFPTSIAIASLPIPYQVTCGLDLNRVLEYKIEVTSGWTVTTTMSVLGYYE